MRRDPQFTKAELIKFESVIAELFQDKKIRCPIHLSGGNEDQLIELFKNIKPDDYVFSNHRNHYHYLLHTGDFEGLLEQMLNNPARGSMHTVNRECNFFTSAITAGCVAIAAGAAFALKKKKSKKRVWCFIGDGASDSGWFAEALRYSACNDLPITYVIEDNDRSVTSSKCTRWGSSKYDFDNYAPYLYVYRYKPQWPHVGIGKEVSF